MPKGRLAPVLFRKGALGNTRDLMVSPHHRMLLQDWRMELLFAENEVLVSADRLVNDHSILRVRGGRVTYVHILFDSHEIVFAEGIPSESFHPAARGMDSLSRATREELLTLYPELARPDSMIAARRELTLNEVSMLL